MSEPHPIVRAVNVTKSYRLGRARVPALQGVSLSTEPAAFAALAGPASASRPAQSTWTDDPMDRCAAGAYADRTQRASSASVGLLPVPRIPTR
jgi:hypothetical protein